MSKPRIICVAVTGSLPRKARNPAAPISVAEQVGSAQDAIDAGASLVHCRVRNDHESLSSDPERLRLGQETLAPSNAALVRRVVEICDHHGRPVAKPAETPAILHLSLAA